MHQFNMPTTLSKPKVNETLMHTVLWYWSALYLPQQPDEVCQPTETDDESCHNSRRWGGGSWDAGLVCDNLYVGSLNAAQDIAMLKARNITMVMTIANGLILTLPEDVTHLVIEIPDHPIADVLSIVEQTTTHIDLVLSNPDSNSGVLVHCASGISRSVSVCCAWLMLRRSINFADALQQIRKNRPLANPNVGFHAQLTTLSAVLNRNTSDSEHDKIVSAQTQYTQQLGGQTIMDALFQQRETANALHADVDVLEIAIKQETNLHSLSSEHIEAWREALLEILKRGKTAEQTEHNHEDCMNHPVDQKSVNVIQDRVANMVRRAAVAKATRLLSDLDL